MDKTEYYLEMVKRNRLIPIRNKGRILGVFSFFICNGDIEKYIDKPPWTVLDDNPDGDTVYVDQLVGIKGVNHYRDAFRIWDEIKDYLKTNFPKINKIRWNRYKNGKVYQFKEEFRCIR